MTYIIWSSSSFIQVMYLFKRCECGLNVCKLWIKTVNESFTGSFTSIKSLIKEIYLVDVKIKLQPRCVMIEKTLLYNFFFTFTTFKVSSKPVSGTTCS